MSDDRCVILLIMLLCNWELMILCVTQPLKTAWCCTEILHLLEDLNVGILPGSSKVHDAKTRHWTDYYSLHKHGFVMSSCGFKTKKY